MPLHVSSTCAHHQGVKIALPPDDEHMCSKHVEEWNKLIVKQKFYASSWLITDINIPTMFPYCFFPVCFGTDPISLQILFLRNYIPLAPYFNVTYPTWCACHLKVKALYSSKMSVSLYQKIWGDSFQKTVIFNEVFSLHIGFQRRYPQAQITSIGGMLCGTEKHDGSLMAGTVSSARM